MKTCALLPGCCCDACSIGGCSLGGVVDAVAAGTGVSILNDGKEEARTQLRAEEDESSSTCSSVGGCTAEDGAVRRRRRTRGSAISRGLVFLVISGVVSLVIGVLSIIWTPFDIFMSERLKMVRGLPAYEWWRNPPDEVLLRVYIFNVTNGKEFLSGKEKLKVEEVGPFIFREKLRHTNITFNDNGTLSYVAHRTAHFLPEMNTLSLNARLVLPNLPLLGMASYLHDASLLTKMGFNIFLRRYDAQPLIELSVNEYLWNYTDPMLQTARRVMPFLVPVDNIGILHTIYHDFRDEVTVYIGPGNGERFFLIDKYRGDRRLGYWEEEPCDVAAGSSEGVAYPQFLTKNFTLLYLRKTLCRVAPLYYAADMWRKGMLAYRFDLPNNSFDTSEKNPENSCYIRSDSDGLKSNNLPAGLLDVSPCYFDFPIAASFPHFLHGDLRLFESMDGLHPDHDKHGSYVIVEPVTGVPMESRARSQSNLVIRNLTGIHRVGRFNGMVIPMFWAEYNQVGLPWYISSLMYFVVVILPILQRVVSFILVSLGASLLLAGVFGCLCVPTITGCRHRNRNFPDNICLEAEDGDKNCINKKCRKKPILVPYSYSSLDLIPSSRSSSGEI